MKWKLDYLQMQAKQPDGESNYEHKQKQSISGESFVQ